MEITLIICTYNRCDSLRTVLNSIVQLDMPHDVEWEVLVVDNNSSDRTREIVAEFSGHNEDRFRYFFEPRQGKCHALNSGIREARGAILAFTDDDVTVSPAWLRNLTSNLHSGEWAGAAGQVLRTWPCSPPNWLSLQPRYEKTGWPLVSFDLHREAGELPLEYPPVGANMAFRKEIFAKHGGFRTDLGPRRNDTGIGSSQEIIGGVYEDTEFGRRLMQSGEKLRYEPSAVIYHPVEQRRLTKEYFLSWWFGRGRDTNLILPKRGPVWGIPRYYLRVAKLVVSLVGHTLAWVTAIRPDRRFYYKVLVWELAGAIMGAIVLHRGERQNSKKHPEQVNA